MHGTLWTTYEIEKQRILQEATSHEEYERLIRELLQRLGL